MVPSINAVLSGNATEQDGVLFLELHGTIPGLRKMHGPLAKMRALSDSSNVPFFTFTLVREPISYLVSYFIMFHHPECHFKWCGQTYNLTEENLVKSAIPNRQCLTYSRGQQEIKALGPDGNKMVDYWEVRDRLWTDWDWVGLTEELNSTTLPMLSHMLHYNTTAAVGMKSYKSDATADKMRLRTDNLSPKTLAYLRNITLYDAQLFKSVQRDYTLSMWKDLPKTLGQ